MALDGAEVLVIGAGGAARAVVFALRARGARVRVANRTPERAAELGDPVPFTRDALDAVAARSALVVNTTSLGLHDAVVPPDLPLSGIGVGQVVADIVYRPGAPRGSPRRPRAGRGPSTAWGCCCTRGRRPSSSGPAWRRRSR